MPLLNWGAFEGLPGSAQVNFEMLCRALIRRHYGRHGRFAARVNQPGVEFHLKLSEPCSLGDAGHWFGWQCRWYELSGKAALGSARRKKIEEAIATSEKELPGLTHWVLWTRRPLTKADQDWYFGLPSRMHLQLWTASEVDEHLAGDGEILRGAYFGDLVLTDESLAGLHAVAISPVKRRWHPELHQTVDAERGVRRALAETGIWHDLAALASVLKIEAGVMRAQSDGLPDTLADGLNQTATAAHAMSVVLMDTHLALRRGDLDLVRQLLDGRPRSPLQGIVEVPRRLRASRHLSALVATNVLADIRRGGSLLDAVNRDLEKRVVAVVASAGCGKTHLSAQLTAPASDRPAGVLLHGGHLRAGGTLGHLASDIVIAGHPVPSMEALVAAVDAAGQRAHRRMPIVVDALNEAEDPRNWRGALASLDTLLRAYPYVLVVCTLRTDFVDDCLPPDTPRYDIPDFGRDSLEAIRRYFAYYRIDATDVEIPFDLLSHPLTLHLFCEVTNPRHESYVGVEAMPGSLTTVFDRYLERAAERIAELAPLTRRYYQQDVHAALDKIGWALWENHSRGLALDTLRRLLGDDGFPWDQSIVRALEQEGVLIRESEGHGEPPRVTAAYDTLGGHLVASAILTNKGRMGFEGWLQDTSTQTAFTGSYEHTHPLANDILAALVGLVPRRLHRQQLWLLVNEPLKTHALRAAADLDAGYLDGATVAELARLARYPRPGTIDLLSRLRRTRSAPSHPLNAEFLDSLLRSMRLTERDLRWSEWIRRSSEEVMGDLEWLRTRWSKETRRPEIERLLALWVMWSLSSTVRDVRDQATLTLYEFGCRYPAALFDLTVKALAIDDPYVPERMLAASYGSAMALHADPVMVDFSHSVLRDYGLALYQSLFADSATYSTTHALMRDFARHTIDLAVMHNPTMLDSSQRKRTTPPFAAGGIRRWGRGEAFESGAVIGYGEPFHMDFANYTLGRLVPDRGNYDFKNREYRGVVANIYWRLRQLGYSPADFHDVDKEIASSHWTGRSSANAGRIDRYGKKYLWISFYELYGYRHDRGLLKGRFSERDERPSDVDVDPSFPREPRDVQIVRADWLGDRSLSLQTWIDRGRTPDIRPYLVLDDIDGVPGPWALLDGFILQVDKSSYRAVYAHARGQAVAKKNAERLRTLLVKDNLRLGLPEPHEDYYTFAGEIPWCDTYPANGFVDLTVEVGVRAKQVAEDELRFYRGRKRISEQERVALLKRLQVALLGDEPAQALEILKSEGLTARKSVRYGERKESIIETVPIFVPVRENNWESYHSSVNPAQSAIVPAREIAESLRLFRRPPAWDLYDSEGQLATTSIRWGNLWENGHNLCYIRTQLLERFLKARRLEFTWAFWGAREMRLDSRRPESEVQPGKVRMEFQRAYSYSGGRVVAAGSPKGKTA